MSVGLTHWKPTADSEVALATESGAPQVAIAHCASLEGRALVEASCLSFDERMRARQFRREIDRSEFALGRAIVRRVLAKLLDISPDEVRFHARPGRKPALCRSHGRVIDVSISHSNGWVACGFVEARRIGIDLEVPVEGRPVDFDGVAQHFLSESELGAFWQMPRELRRIYFFDAWRRKEAILKAIGCGLSKDPCSLELSSSHIPRYPNPCEIVAFAGQLWKIHVLARADLPEIAVAHSM